MSNEELEQRVIELETKLKDLQTLVDSPSTVNSFVKALINMIKSWRFE